MPKIVNVRVESHALDADYCVSWQSKSDSYHIWLERGTYKLRPGVGTGGRSIYKHLAKEPGSAARVEKIIYLDQRVQKNQAMVDDAIAEAVAEHLFEKCDAELAAKEQERLAKAAEEYKVTLARHAGPQLLAALQNLYGVCRERISDATREQVEAALKLATEETETVTAS